MRQPRTKRPRLALLLQSIRVLTVATLLMLIPPPRSGPIDHAHTAPELKIVQSVLPSAERIDDADAALGLWGVRDRIDKLIGYVVRTLPESNGVIGYRGPSESAIVLDPDMTIVGVRLISSTDTDEHVDAVQADDQFFQQFLGWPWGGPQQEFSIDGVSGATLTSMAVASGVLTRIDGNRPSLLFPNEITIDEVDHWFTDAAAIDESRTISIVRDPGGREIGRVLRTGPHSDDITGYRGPSELLMRLDDNDRVITIELRSSYDNEPFTGWVRNEFGFWELFQEQSIQQLGEFDPDANGVEGVSGATMTSMAIADTIVAAAAHATSEMKAESLGNRRLFSWLTTRWSRGDLATVLVLVIAAMTSKLHWFRHRWFRRIWLITVIVVIGVWTGNLVSMALIAGWAGGGVAWQLAPGLAGIAIVALLAPPIRGANPYCYHLCPHGALQQLIKPSPQARRRGHLSNRQAKWLRKIPAALLIVAYALLIVTPRTDLSSWEPFHAYLFTIAGWGSITLAIVSLAFAAVIPMGYCRFGCPTGSLLDYLRRSARSDRLRLGDGVCIGLLIFALTVGTNQVW